MAQKRKRSKKWLRWVIILVLLVMAGIVGFLIWDNSRKDNNSDNEMNNSSATQTEEKKSEETEKVQNEEEEDEADDKKVVQYEGEDPNLKDELSGVVTYAGVNGDKLAIRVNIDQYIEDGTCKLILERNGTSIYSAEAGIVGSASTATCEGFDVLVGGLGNGKTTIIIKINSNGKTGEITGEVEL